MRKSYWLWCLSLLTLCGASVMAAEESGNDERRQKLEKMLETAIDRFQLNRFIEARAELNRLLAENPTDEEAFRMRKVFGEKILLEMQRFGNRPVLNSAERRALQILGEAAYALDRSNPEKAANRLEEVTKIFQEAKYPADSFELKYATELANNAKELNNDATAEILALSEKVHRWQEQLQSVGNVPLVLLSRAQRFEQSQLRSPEVAKGIVARALSGNSNSQRNLVEIVRLGVYAVPPLLDAIRDQKNDVRRTNAHFVLLTLGNRALQPLCEALKSKDQLFLQQLCSVLGEIRPADKRAVPYLKTVYDNPENLPSTRKAAGAALRNISGEDPEKMLPAADYFLREANRLYLGGDDIDQELRDANNTFWVWDSQAAGGKGALSELPVPVFALGDMLAEEQVYRGLATAKDKTPFQVLLASIFLQQKNRVDTYNKLLAREDLSHPETAKLRSDALDWGKRLERNNRVVYTLGPAHLAGVLEKALRDRKTEVAISVLDALSAITGPQGWAALKDYKISAAVVPAGRTAKAPEKNGKPAAVANLQGMNPVLAAMEDANPRIAIAAANALVNMGLPKEHAAYKKLLPLLLSGAQENRATVVEVISGNNNLRYRLLNDLERGQMVPLVASDGYAGYGLAVQFPPKDVILVDSRLDQFNVLRLQLSLRNVAQNRMLPLTIITTKAHLKNISMQFVREALLQEAENKHIDVENLLSDNNDNFTNDDWNVVVRHDVNSEQKNIFEGLRKILQSNVNRQAVVLITQPNRAERFKLKESLLLRAEREMRPDSLSEFANMRQQDKVLGDIFGVRVSYSPVFVDEELSGYDTMATVQALQTDPRTRPVPIAILAENSGENLKNLNADYERFISEGLVEIIADDIESGALLDKILAMKKRNVLSEKNYARALSNDLATRSARGMAKLEVAGCGRKLTAEEEKILLTIVTDVSRPEALRIATVETLGHFQARSVLKKLVQLFGDLRQKNTALRVALVRAIGEIDRENTELDFKLAVMSDPSVEVQREAARALGPAAQNQEQLKRYMEDLRPNDPLKLLQKSAAPLKKAENAEGEEEGEKKEEGESGDKAENKEESSEKTEEKAEEKTEEKSEDSEKKDEEKKDGKKDGKKDDEEFNW